MSIETDLREDSNAEIAETRPKPRQATGHGRIWQKLGLFRSQVSTHGDIWPNEAESGGRPAAGGMRQGGARPAARGPNRNGPRPAAGVS